MSLPLPLRRDSASFISPALWAVLAELVLTSVHHGYGAVIYAAPFRFQVVVISAVVAAVELGLTFVTRYHRGSRAGRIAGWRNLLVITAYPIIAIGLIEGGYNHVVKNIVYLMGYRQLYDGMFPAAAYEVPGDWFFEITGIVQFPVAIAAIWLGITAWRSRH